jgi:hypothetical protein
MARDIDSVIEFVRNMNHIAPVQRQVLINRIELWPTQAELDQAYRDVYPACDEPT